ncbi:Bug family tripartite tricarboxylate transporter substrate binding protein [Variovorax sp. LT2P21]|uniref:Bug family tripartite tricarboxylate transporter substrate binding protein n=1 Tax=Variovorax sp. LT2P21 TaxID=3443731 RepID=UPI003F49B16C
MTALATLPGVAVAQPGGQVMRIVVPFGAGSAPDIVARTLADPLAADLGAPVAVENMPGAGGMLGVTHVVNATPDGRTVVMSGDAALVMPDPNRVRRYDPQRDLAPISRLVATPNVLVVSGDTATRNLTDWLVWLRQQPTGRISYASAGVGTSSHRAGELLAKMTGVEMTHVPSNQSPLPDVIAGRVDFFFANVATAMPLVREGRLRALAVSSLHRTPIAPELPTLAESGLTGFDATAWFAMLAPAATPPEMLARWQRAGRMALATPLVSAKLHSLGIEAIGESPEELSETIKRESGKWAGLIR